MLSHQRKVLIVSASIGSGHDQAAQAIAQQFAVREPGAEVSIVDFMSGELSYLHSMLKETYLKMLSFSPDAYELLYRWTQSRQGGISPVQGLLALAMHRTMRKLLEQFQPDVLVCTHPFPCAAAVYLKRKRQMNIPLAAVITDFTVHRLWVYPEVDAYFVAAAEVAALLKQHGICREKIYVTGIPIADPFRRQYDRTAFLQEQGLSPQVPVVLLMGGGLGLGCFEQLIEELEVLPQAVQLVVVTGHNGNLRRSMHQAADASRHRIHVVGYSEQIAAWMAAADVLITKPGALTLSEAMAMKVPMVLYEAIPGQEKDNAAYMTDHQAAVCLADNREVGAVTAALLQEPEQLQAMRQHLQRLRKPEAAVKIASILTEYMNKPYSYIAGL